MKCERCGWDTERRPLKPLEVTNWPEGLPAPPPLPDYEPHGNTCPSPFAVGDVVYWDMGGLAEDLPPILGRFICLTHFHGPDFRLDDGVWVQEGETFPTLGIIEINEASVLQEHREIIGPDLDEKKLCFPVLLGECHPAVKWPVLT